MRIFKIVGVTTTLVLSLEGCSLTEVKPNAAPEVAEPPPPQIALAPAPAPAPETTIIVVPIPPPPPLPVVAEDIVVASQILSEVAKALSGGGDSLRRENASAVAAWGRARTEANRLRVALMAIVTSAGPADDQRALSLLEPFLARGAEPSMFKTVAELVAVPLIEKSRLVREEQKKAEAARVSAEASKKELDVVQQKLEALRQLERTLGKRGTR
jgi:hypothetical protein